MTDLTSTPTICNEAVCITDSPIYAAIISSYFNRKNQYFTLIETPRLSRPDASNEMIRRNNVLAYLKPYKVILANVDNNVVLKFLEYIPIRRIIRIRSVEEIDKIMHENFIVEHAGEVRCQESQIELGLILAKIEKKKLVVDPKANKLDSQKHSQINYSEHLVALDDTRGIAPIVAANYAYSINAETLRLPEPDGDQIEIVYDDISASRYYKGTNRGHNATRSLISQQLTFESYLPGGKIDASFVTFITRGVPYGYFFPDVPSTHLFSYPDLGITIFKNIYYASKIKGTRSALLIDPDLFPKDWGKTETGFVSRSLRKMGAHTKELRGREAKVYITGQYLQWYPYDLLFICSHASRMDGKQLTIKFKDRDDDEHEIVIEEAISFGLTDEGEGLNRKVEVLHFMGFVSIDGVEWRDKKEKKIKKGITEDFLAIPREKWEIISRKDIPYVRRSTRIRLSDGDQQVMLHGVAGGTMPFIFNNACVSFYEFSGKFLFAGARGYIGTLTPVDTDFAKEVAKKLFSRLNPDKPLPILLWEIQQEVFNDPQQRIYIHVGTHFCNILPPEENPTSFLKSQMNALVEGLERKLQDKEEDVVRNSEKAISFLNSVKL